jgi:hypothetical protein
MKKSYFFSKPSTQWVEYFFRKVVFYNGYYQGCLFFLNKDEDATLFYDICNTTATPKKRGAKFRKACCWGFKTNKSYFFDLLFIVRDCMPSIVKNEGLKKKDKKQSSWSVQVQDHQPNINFSMEHHGS